jgi:hypothetical protein
MRVCEFHSKVVLVAACTTSRYQKNSCIIKSYHLSAPCKIVPRSDICASSILANPLFASSSTGPTIFLFDTAAASFFLPDFADNAVRLIFHQQIWVSHTPFVMCSLISISRRTRQKLYWTVHSIKETAPCYTRFYRRQGLCLPADWSNIAVHTSKIPELRPPSCQQKTEPKRLD